MIKKTKFEKDKTIYFSSCGINGKIAEKYLMKKKYLEFVLVNPEDADYIIMTNRVTLGTKNNPNKIINCFDKFNGENLSSVERNGLILSAIKKNLKF